MAKALAVDKKDPRRQEWSTPDPIMDALVAEYAFDIDAAASVENAKLPRYWTKEDNALAQDWRGLRVFCNPPWNNILPFIKRGLLAEAAVFLVPARTDTYWFRMAVEFSGCEVHFYGPGLDSQNSTGRVEYVPALGIVASKIAFGSMALVMGSFVKEPGAIRFRDAKTGRLVVR